MFYKKIKKITIYVKKIKSIHFHFLSFPPPLPPEFFHWNATGIAAACFISALCAKRNALATDAISSAARDLLLTSAAERARRPAKRLLRAFKRTQ
jgi:hypothetical protein